MSSWESDRSNKANMTAGEVTSESAKQGGGVGVSAGVSGTRNGGDGKSEGGVDGIETGGRGVGGRGEGSVDDNEMEEMGAAAEALEKAVAENVLEVGGRRGKS